MEESRLGPAIWRIEVYDIRDKVPFTGYLTDLSNFYTSDLKIKRQRNYPDEVTFTLDLSQLQARADKLGFSDPHDILEPYMHKVKIYRENTFICQAIVTKTSVNLNNEPKSTVEVSCVDILGILEKRLIHQDYGEGSWADFAKEVIMDAQHEPNRIYNYAFEGDGTSIDNVWFRGWKFSPSDTLRDVFPDWEPNKLYSMYDKCNHGGRFWEAKEHAFYSGETFSESNWTLLGILDDETGETAAAYAVWREDDEDAGPTGTSFGGWGGTSSCHVSAQTFSINNGGSVSSINMAGSSVSTSLVSPISNLDPQVPDGYQRVEYIESDGTQYTGTGIIPSTYDNKLKIDITFQLTSLVPVGTSVWVPILACNYGAPGSSSWSYHPRMTFSTNNSYQFCTQYSSGPGGSSSETTLTSGDVSADTEKHNAVIDLTGNAGQTSIVLDGVTVGTSPNIPSVGPAKELYMFSTNVVYPTSSQPVASTIAKMKVYMVKFFNTDGVLVGSLVPCYRKSDGKPGFYDTVAKAFHTQLNSSATSDFTYGKEVPNGEQIFTRVMARNAKQTISISSSSTSQSGNIVSNFNNSTAASGVVTLYSNKIPAGEKITNYKFVYSDNGSERVVRFTIGVSNSDEIVVWDKAISKYVDGAWYDMDSSALLRAMRSLGVTPGAFYSSPSSTSMNATITINSSSSIVPSTFRLFIEGYGGKRRIYSPVMSLGSARGWQTAQHIFPAPGYDIYRFGILMLTGDAIFDTPLCYIKPEEGDLWDLGIRLGDFPSDDDQRKAEWNRGRHTPTYEWKNAKSTLLDLSNMDSDNFWYNIDENYKFNVYVNAGSDAISLELSYPRNITSMTVTSNASDIVNYIKGDGSAEVKQDPLVSGMDIENAAPFTWIGNNKAGMEKYWALAAAVRYDSERDITSLRNDIESEIATFADIQDVPEIKVANNAISPEDIHIGDMISVEAIDIPYIKRANGLYKITAYTIQVDMDGNESITLTLLKPTQNQINALAFPQLIKNLMLRLGGKR